MLCNLYNTNVDCLSTTPIQNLILYAIFSQTDPPRWINCLASLWKYSSSNFLFRKTIHKNVLRSSFRKLGVAIKFAASPILKTHNTHTFKYRVSPKIRQGLILLFFRKITPGLILGGYHLFSFIKNKIAK